MMRTFLGILLIMSLLAGGCSKNIHASGSGHAPVTEIKTNQAVVANLNGFAFRFMGKLQSRFSDKDNIFVSPLSLHMDLGMLLNGAHGTTYAEMADLLDLNTLSLDDVNQVYATLLDALPKADPEVQLGLYNSVWYRNGLNILSAFSQSLKDDFQAEMTGLDFKPGDEKTINQWASEKTNGKVTKILDAINDTDMMFLLNALYFKGDWSVQFDKQQTKSADFHFVDGSTGKVNMMHQTDTFYNYIGPDYAAVRLPYGNGQFCMTVILPASGLSIDQFFNDFTDAGWADLQSNLKLNDVQVGLPRFTIPAFEARLDTVLMNMGMKTAFSEQNADFSKITESRKLFVSFIKQNSYLRVDEEGTEAAAVTSIGAGTTSVNIPPSIICDHPFGIIISEQTSNTILFMGRIMAPGSGG